MKKGGRSATLARVLSYRNFAILSVIHSIMFTGLMICAFFLGGPDPATFIFGFSHGVLYPLMAIAAIVAARIKTLSVTTALVIAIAGLAGPYFGTFDLLRFERERMREQIAHDSL